MKRRIAVLALCLAIAFAALATFRIITNPDFGRIGSQNIASLQTAIHQHEREMQRLANIAADSLASNANIDAFRLLESLTESNNYSIYIVDDNRAAAWSNATLPDNCFAQLIEHLRIINTENGCYFAISHTIDRHRQVFVLLRLQSHYPFDNEYLKPTFDASLNIEPRCRLSTTEQPNGLNIRDTDGIYLFTIIDRGSAHLSYARIALCFVLLLVWLVAAIAFVVFAVRLIVTKTHYRNRALLFALALLIGVYAWALSIRLPEQMSAMFIFSAGSFAFDRWMPSLAYMLLATTLGAVWSYLIFRYIDFKLLTYSRRSRIVFVFGILVALYVFFAVINFAVNILVYHSTDIAIYVDNLDITGPSIVKIVVLSLLAIAFILIQESIYSRLIRTVAVRDFCIALAVFAVFIQLPFSLLLDWFPYSFHIGFLLLSILYFGLRRRDTNRLKYSSFVWVMFAISFYMMLRLTELNQEKEQHNRELLINNLAFQLVREDDPVAETLLLSIEEHLANDSLIVDAMANAYDDANSKIYSHLREHYFDGYLSRYELQVVPCRGQASTIRMTNSGDQFNCYSYFNSMIAAFGSRIKPNSHFYCLNDNDGSASYFGQFDYADAITGRPNRLYIELNARPYSDEIGYPEILTNERDRINRKQLGGYSYAKYFDGWLSTSYGDFAYPNICDDFMPEDGLISRYIADERYTHLALVAMPGQLVVLSYPRLTIGQFLADYSYLFLSMFLVCTASLWIISKRKSFIFSNMTIHERIQSMFVLLAMTLLVVLCIVAGRQSIARYETTTRAKMSQLITSVDKMLFHEFGTSDNIASENPSDVDGALQRLSSLFFVDAHVYSLDGQMVGSSRRELFTGGIVAPLINAEALLQLRTEISNEVIALENIGTLVHYSIYAPIYNEYDDIIGYVGVPFFNDLNAMRQQLLSTFVPITNSYMLIILLSILFSYFLANGITKPLIRLSEKLRHVDLGTHNEKIDYPNNDEIGILVREYNRMLDELEKSAEKLAVSERESTWREMAKQIAHEIKNPLTPMKLSVQYLQRAWNEQRNDFDAYLNRVAHMLIEQIDQLSAIASQFSDVAKMQTAELSRIDICQSLANAVALFEKAENATVTLQQNCWEAFAMANAKQMTSVFNNLIKNALQAAKPDEAIRIDAKIELSDGKILITLSDNGRGIAADARDKIFRPNFTTKSTGMGLGLAIVKTILTNMGADIRFETQEGVGTTFFITINEC